MLETPTPPAAVAVSRLLDPSYGELNQFLGTEARDPNRLARPSPSSSASSLPSIVRCGLPQPLTRQSTSESSAVRFCRHNEHFDCSCPYTCSFGAEPTPRSVAPTVSSRKLDRCGETGRVTRHERRGCCHGDQLKSAISSCDPCGRTSRSAKAEFYSCYASAARAQ